MAKMEANEFKILLIALQKQNHKKDVGLVWNEIVEQSKGISIFSGKKRAWNNYLENMLMGLQNSNSKDVGIILLVCVCV